MYIPQANPGLPTSRLHIPQTNPGPPTSRLHTPQANPGPPTSSLHTPQANPPQACTPMHIMAATQAPPHTYSLTRQLLQLGQQFGNLGLKHADLQGGGG